MYVTPDNLIVHEDWAKSALSLADVTCKYQYTVQNLYRNWPDMSIKNNLFLVTEGNFWYYRTNKGKLS